jgi:hypothetical protein
MEIHGIVSDPVLRLILRFFRTNETRHPLRLLRVLATITFLDLAILTGQQPRQLAPNLRKKL